MIDNEQKLIILGKIKAGIPLKEISRELRIPFPEVLQIKEEYENAENKELILKSLEDNIVLEKVADSVKHEIEALKKEIPLSERITNIEDRLERLSLLSDEVQLTALKALEKIKELLDTDITVKEMSLLIDGLAKLQTAFFKSQSPVVNVVNQPTYSEKTLQVFQDLKKP